MSIWGKLFGAEKVVDAGIRAGDALFFTSEEKAEWRLRLLKAYEPFKIAQRWLAVIMTTPFVGIHVLAGLQILVTGWLPGEMGKSVHEAALVVMEHNNDTLALPVAIILGFYFAGGMAEGAITANIERKAANK